MGSLLRVVVVVLVVAEAGSINCVWLKTCV